MLLNIVAIALPEDRSHSVAEGVGAIAGFSSVREPR